ncbi:hypothetical protein KP509_14G049200 [Ceratopteris richardii]|uniref:GDSL esterase/lipase n=1 Tax=Ceratopteris richardii TaxID=49495 RepID=A0A8T2T9I8_CERRI|nr:hypothetical protein KP509_14G049200 [Ceratopteris richardii]
MECSTTGKAMLLFSLLAALSTVNCSFRGLGTLTRAELRNKKRREPVYVFGDSYADTGNHDPNSANASINKPWRVPYGNTWPGKPLGRYSDGRLLTDFYVSFLHEKLPELYRLLNIDTYIAQRSRGDKSKTAGLRERGKGISFAFGGSGVFDTLNTLVYNVSTQIDQLHSIMELGIVTPDDIASSSVLFVLSGNDYEAYTTLHPDLDGIQQFIVQVVNQIAIDLEELASIGFKKFTVTTVPPLGCLPYISHVNNYSSCVDTVNQLCEVHNTLLKARISDLGSLYPNTSFTLLDLYSSILAVVEEGSFTLTPCCEGSCGEVDVDDNPQYTLCSDATKTLYWDSHHPTNAAWEAITNILFSSVHSFDGSIHSF